MGKLVRWIAMFGGLSLAIVGAVTLKKKLAVEDAPAVRLESKQSRNRSTEPRIANQPTILQAKPRSKAARQASPYEAGYMPQNDPVMPSDRPFSNSPAIPQPLMIPDESSPAFPTSGPMNRGPATDEVNVSPDAVQASLQVEVTEWPENREPSRHPSTWETIENDSLWRISEKRYGAGVYYRALFALNRQRIARPDKIPAGLILVTPDRESLKRQFPELIPKDSLPSEPASVTHASDGETVLR